ncbi:hypothetical protein [Acinetobacter phage BUCT629]|uniref:Uncharacterized protein n=8 Tax=root TaxID=1 RepID=A0A1V0DZD1_9CAUD|nr:hypothetical protein [Escherichia coli]YP_009600545.1 hypothetical protein FDH41_gp51 [Acinetobacter phage WCHABP12]YP_009604549.1 hypothetical protein FDH91_gp58 [Acinetobacter phage WCHABP1]AYP69047.1 hypothetical protein [Acinetobacter phage vB_AbaM_IME512]QZI85371.1 hypothetical protein [Acinetobacter phage BUCT629]URY98795.1 hypothetical protein Arbor_81 [Acinetobacter phage Arbor]WHB31283.1 hypothetical protein [Acinetobacter phage P1068]WPH63937.1 hypothetical protein [Acinetobacte
MNKLELAHSYALLHMTIPQYKDVDDLELVGWAFDYAEAMLAENEKRKDKSLPEVLEEWKLDWSQAPDGANWWAMDESGRSFWFAYEPYISSEYPDEWIFNGKNHGGIGHEYWKSPNFNYQGDWKDSLRKRP